MSAVRILLAILLVGTVLVSGTAVVLALMFALDKRSDRENEAFEVLSVWSDCDDEGATVDELAGALRVRGQLGRAGLVMALARLMDEGRIERLPAGSYRAVTR